MTPAQVLQSLGLERYLSAFQENCSDAETLLTLNDGDLKGLGITKLGDRKRLLVEIEKLRAGGCGGGGSGRDATVLTDPALEGFCPPMTNPAIPGEPEYYIVPIVLSEEPKLAAAVRGANARHFRRRLAEHLGAREFTIEEVEAATGNGLDREKLPVFDRPCVFLVYFVEHADMDLFLADKMNLLFLHPAALPLFFYLPSLGQSPFKVKMEEVYLLNLSLIHI